jgi:hypothetical protein
VTGSAPGDPDGNAHRPQMARTAASSHANVTTPGTSPRPPQGSATAQTAAAAGISEFRQQCALNGRRHRKEGTLHAAERRPRAARTIPRTGRRMRTRRHLHRGFAWACPLRGRLAAASRGQGVAAPAAGNPRRGRAGPANVPYRQLFRTPLRIPADTGTPGPGECAGSARNKPSRELPDYIYAHSS